MIHISQDELFRKIETEHDCNNLTTGNQRRQQPSKSFSTTNELTEVKKRSSCGSILSGSSSGSLDTRVLFADDMSSMLLAQQDSSKTSSSVTAAVAPASKEQNQTHKDKNNNDNNQKPRATTASHYQSTPTIAKVDDDEEVQAVLITGCGSKIGSNIAVAFAAQGLKVALVDFDIQQTEAVARECQEKSPKNRVPLQIVADMSQLSEAHKVIDRTIEAFGRLDVLVNTVNNASLMEAKFNASGDDDPHVFEQYHKIIANNMHSVTYLCISAAPYLRKTRGSIVNVSSITNNETGSYKFAYCMSKAGISTLTKCLATDLAPDIKVICVSPKSDASVTS